MNDRSLNAELQKIFQKSSLNDWETIAKQEIKGDAPFEKLLWQGKDNISFRPYYDITSEKDLLFIRDFSHPSATRTWLNLPLLSDSKWPSDANKIALDHLMQGADGVVFDVRGVDADVKALTHNIQWPYCYISFFTDSGNSLLKALHETHIPASAQGAIFWDTIPRNSDLSFFFRSCPEFRTLGIRIDESSPAEEICDALVHGVTAFEMYNGQAADEKLFRSIAFSLPADARLLETIAKFKALRLLWFQVAQAYNLSQYRPEHVFLHAHSVAVPDSSFGPNENMIKGTFAAMAAVMGGCDGLTVAHEPSNPYVVRCARNVSTILAQEAFFGRAADPLAGAWTLESMTKAIAQKAWQLFQHKMHNHETA